jgi:hypothetical protein
LNPLSRGPSRRAALASLAAIAMVALAGAPRAAAPASAAAAWPHAVAAANGSAIVYEPQVVSWPDLRTLHTRIALAITPKGAAHATLGTVDVAFVTRSDLATRTVTLTAPKLEASHFPTADPAQAQRFAQAIGNTLATLADKKVPLDAILLSLDKSKHADKPVALRNDPPDIVYSSRPASLVVFDGKPVLAPISGTSLSVAVNTNWDVFFDDDSKAWYLLDNGAWLKSTDMRGSGMMPAWSPADPLPAAFAKLPADANYKAVKQQIPGRRLTRATMPTIVVTTHPAVIIVTDGPPKLVPIAGTSLRYVANTDVNLFVDTADGKYYLLTSGRWYASPRLDGHNWTFATDRLPADFARIPPSSARGSVLSSVPGTPQAAAALLQAQIPTQASLERATAKVTVVYSGEPKFVPIQGTTMTYAVNTMFDVIAVGNTYYTCYHGAWFVATSPTGTWVLADSIPPVIYTIPPSNPLYRVTYVEVYGNTATTVTYGYTIGYEMGYVSSGVVVYGTGYYYPPVIWPAPIPIYYPYPYTFTGTTWYNPNTGSWARGGTVYGPYGGAVSGGTAYNPNTGAWAHGGAVYGPNGGAGAWSAYNPSTGGYAHGSASWGTNSGTANANWYNGRTGVTGSTNQNYNQYGSWGSSTFSGADKTVNTQHQSNANGTAGSFNSSTGAKGAGAKGANGNSAGVAKGANGDVYAGANGNVYRKTSDGWSEWNNGSWNPVTPPDDKGSHSGSGQGTSGQARNANGNQNLSGQTRNAANGNSNLSGETRQSGQNLSGETQHGAGSRSQNLSGQTERGGAFRGRELGSEQYNQLESDRFARTEGADRMQRFSGGGGGARFAGRRR